MAWCDAFERIRPHIVRIEDTGGQNQYGTGFWLGYAAGGQLAAVATSYHVVGPAHAANRDVSLTHIASGTLTAVRLGNDNFRFDANADCATILIPADRLPFPDECLRRIGTAQYAKPGFPVAWVGFPDLAREQLCFLTGHISCYFTGSNIYLIDGAAMHGISGGPVFTEWPGETVLVGAVLGYGPEQPALDGLPSLTGAHDLGIFLNQIEEVN